MMTGLDVNRIYQGLAILTGQGRDAERSLRLVADYASPNDSEKVLRLIVSYTNYVNRTVWSK